jgi:hypothetical protein
MLSSADIGGISVEFDWAGQQLPDFVLAGNANRIGPVSHEQQVIVAVPTSTQRDASPQPQIRSMFFPV